MPRPRRPFGPRQKAQNAAFLAALARTGNARLAARGLGVHRSTYSKRRARCPAFARAWEEALAASQAHLEESRPRARRRGIDARGPVQAHTRGGEPYVLRLASGRLQLRRALPGRLTGDGEDTFLGALSDTANIRLSAGIAGVAHSSMIVRRNRMPALAAEMEACHAAARRSFARIAEARSRGLRASLDLFVLDDEKWPEGVTIAQALHQLGAPPLKLPGTPFPKKKRP